VLQVARENQLSRFGAVSLDGTKMHANASRHSALSYGHTEAIDAELKGEVQQLLALAEEADAATIPDGTSVPNDLRRRENRLAAKAKIEAQAAERFAREQADHVPNLAARAAKAAATGRQPSGKPPKGPTPSPRPEEQINLADEASRCMPVAGGAFEPSYNAHAVVDTENTLVLVPQVMQAANAKQQLTPSVPHPRPGPCSGRVDPSLPSVEL
jgi:hypothetical protein